MQKIFRVFIVLLGICSSAYTNQFLEVDDSNPESSEFWPPDCVPHPHPHPLPSSGESDGWVNY